MIEASQAEAIFGRESWQGSSRLPGETISYLQQEFRSVNVIQRGKFLNGQYWASGHCSPMAWVGMTLIKPGNSSMVTASWDYIPLNIRTAKFWSLPGTYRALKIAPSIGFKCKGLEGKHIGERLRGCERGKGHMCTPEAPRSPGHHAKPRPADIID